MNYEQKYNEMVQRARELHESGNALTRKQMEIVCPELVESEGERIMSALLRGFNSMLANQPIGTFYGEPIKDILAYLEKLKEQKPAEWSEEDKGLLLSVKCIIDEVWHSKDKFGYSEEELKEMWNWLDAAWQWLEYPTSSWKPSEEQICVLWDAIGDLKHFGYKRVEIVESLYEQLKAL